MGLSGRRQRHNQRQAREQTKGISPKHGGDLNFQTSARREPENKSDYSEPTDKCSDGCHSSLWNTGSDRGAAAGAQVLNSFAPAGIGAHPQVGTRPDPTLSSRGPRLLRHLLKPRVKITLDAIEPTSLCNQGGRGFCPPKDLWTRRQRQW